MKLHDWSLFDAAQWAPESKSLRSFSRSTVLSENALGFQGRESR
jgi:hypothetical protein